jgi:hypothetical protein
VALSICYLDHFEALNLVAIMPDRGTRIIWILYDAIVTFQAPTNRREPTAATADDALREFNGLMEGERLAFRVIASVNVDVEDLKKLT